MFLIISKITGDSSLSHQKNVDLDVAPQSPVPTTHSTNQLSREERVMQKVWCIGDCTAPTTGEEEAVPERKKDNNSFWKKEKSKEVGDLGFR